MDLQSQEAIANLDAENEWEMNEGDAEPPQNETQPIQTVFDSNPGVKADVWKEFVSVGIEEDGKERGRCIHCNKKLVIDKSQGTSSLRRHVGSCHKKPQSKSGSHDRQYKLNSVDVAGTSFPVPSCDRDEVSNIPSKKRQRSSSLSEGQTGSAMLLGLDILDCPVCFEALTSPIFQCDNGHLACFSCCPKLSNKCPTCALHIGSNRCRAMESVLESVFVPCPNAKFGCTKNVPYGKESIHKLECTFSQCSCPALNCNFTGSYNQIYSHFTDDHRQKPKSISFECGSSVDVQMNIASDKMLVLWELKKNLLFALQCFSEQNGGVYVTVRCIAPSAPEVEKFPYCLDYSMDGHTLTYKSPDVEKVLEVSSRVPDDSFMFVPHCLLSGELLEIKLCIGLKETLTSKSCHLPHNDGATSSVPKLLQKINEEHIELDVWLKELKKQSTENRQKLSSMKIIMEKSCSGSE